MKKALLSLLLALFVLLGFFMTSLGLSLIDLVGRWGAMPKVAAITAVAVLFSAAVIYPVAILLAIRRHMANPVMAGSNRHRRYIARLARLHRAASTASVEVITDHDGEYLQHVYTELHEPCEALLHEEATNLFFHTAISQSGRMDGLVALRAQLHLARRVARLYYPGASFAWLPSLYVDVLDATLSPSPQQEIDYAAQIGPAIVGASVVGAIPGASLVSTLIADAVVQGSANALAMLRIGMLTRRTFQRRLEGIPFAPEEERTAANIEALNMLAGLVSVASGSLSRTIWEAARDHLKRIPGATLEGLKTAMTRSVKGLTARVLKKSPAD
ncbi:MAG: hypothetical protein IIA59_08260 [Candidatus Marinimicrobia bacterium]|nr:hypothetical protein [Candidatus Neomarinimicrobiota bacterium]